MISTAILTIGRILVMGLGSIQPAVATPDTLNVPPIVIAARASMAAPRSAVRNYSSTAYLAKNADYNEDASNGGTIELTSEEAALLDQTNREREAEGETDLQPDALLCAVARAHSEDMAQRNYFDHMAPGPGPISPMDRYLAALGSRPDYAFLGENIYYRSATDSTDMSAAQANSAFMHSPEHRANIMQSRFTKVGIGFYRDPNTGAFWVTEEFLRDQN